MSKKDFELIARSLKACVELYDEGENITPAFVARDLAHRLAATNPRFDRARFLRACGVAES